MMRAIAYTGPGALGLVDVEDPQPSDGEVVVEVSALGICGTDLLIWEGGMDRVVPPMVVGHEFSGTVVAVGTGTDATVGTRVAVEPLLNCGRCAPCLRGDDNVCVSLGLIGIDAHGAAARRVAVPAHRLHVLPDELALEDAVLVEPTAVAVHMLGRSGAAPGDTVLIVGGGPIGALVAAVGRAKGIESIVVSEPNPSRREIIAGLGVETVDPVGKDISDIAALSGSAAGFDVVFELTGVPVGLATAVESARVHGSVLLGGLAHSPVALPGTTAVLRELTLRGARTYRSAEFEEAISLLASGAVEAQTFITRTVPLDDAIVDAFGVLRDSRDEMKIVIRP